ncbi:MAG: class I SAM-dependent methyltransferase [Acidobacteria bacterium]|nr:class I SAM-dependent methyltransferase [Acidobacteriota bacterium]
MTTAFGRAMLATINGQPQRFRMTMQNGDAIDMDCREFLTTRPEENQLLDGIALPETGAALDIGCGVGRHLARIRQMRPTVHCWGVEICDLMLRHCRETIAAPATFVRTLADLPPDRTFDLIMLMGNGLGVLGSEEEAVAHIRRLVASLNPAGRIVIEAGNLFGRQGYSSFDFTIDYGGQRDGPFPWGFADSDWVTRTLQNLGCNVQIQPSRAPGGMWFFAVGIR